jgi:hypothetical protein
MSIPVILSFTAALDFIAADKLTQEQLEKAVFALGCGPGWPRQPLDTIVRQHGHYQHNHIAQPTLNLFCQSLDKAEADGRVVWRREFNSGGTVHGELSKSLVRAGLEPLNPNLPPIVENTFLKTAIERVNNKDGNERAWVITDYGSGSH